MFLLDSRMLSSVCYPRWVICGLVPCVAAVKIGAVDVGPNPLFLREKLGVWGSFLSIKFCDGGWIYGKSVFQTFLFWWKYFLIPPMYREHWVEESPSSLWILLRWNRFLCSCVFGAFKQGGKVSPLEHTKYAATHESMYDILKEQISFPLGYIGVPPVWAPPFGSL